MNEPLRPQFHFTAPRGWLNDPNGLVYFDGEYHLFYQHNPHGTEWGNMTWGHAVSPDLVHWEHLPLAIEPYDGGTIYSGSALVDSNNCLGHGAETLLAFYTFAGTPFDQRLAYSTDRGRTWTQFERNPILPNISGENRDPKVFFHAPTERFVMALYVRKNESDGIEFYTSANLRGWSLASRIEGFFECPDCFELPLLGTDETRWVLFGADGDYVTGHFDGAFFTPDGEGRKRGDYGASHYAAQTYADIPASDGRRILIAWMRGGKYPGMLFNQQLSFPVALTLQRRGERVLLCREPVRELERLWRDTWLVEGFTLSDGFALVGQRESECFDIAASLVITPGCEAVLSVRGAEVRVDTAAGTLWCLGRTAPLPLDATTNRVEMRVLCDRTSVEVFADDGTVALSSCFLAEEGARTVSLFAPHGGVHIETLAVRRLHSALDGLGARGDATSP